MTAGEVAAEHSWFGFYPIDAPHLSTCTRCGIVVLTSKVALWPNCSEDPPDSAGADTNEAP